MSYTLDVKKFQAQIEKDFMLEEEKSLIKFNTILKKNKALIAGGSVLRSQTNGWPVKFYDYDIYVNVKNSYNLWNNLINLLLTKYNYFIKDSKSLPPYDDSFFKQNHIYGRILCRSNIKHKFQHGISIPPPPDIDIILVENDIPLEQVVTNFDLSICEIWYNGEVLNATDVKGIMEKKSVLKAQYAKKLLEGQNFFLIKRMQKYKQRGFSILIEKVNEPVYFKQTRKGPSNLEEWLVKTLYNKYLEIGLKSWKTEAFFKAFSKNALSEFTMTKLHSNIININNIADVTIPFRYIVKKSKISTILMSQDDKTLKYQEAIAKYIPNIEDITANLSPFVDLEYSEKGLIGEIKADESKLITCYDPIMDDPDTNVNEFLKDEEQKDSVVIVLPKKDGTYLAYCVSRNEIRRNLSDPTKIKVECIKRVSQNKIFYQITNQPNINKYNQLSFIFPVYVPVLQVLKLLKQTDKIYYLYYTQKKIAVTVSQSVVQGIENSAVGGTHCQTFDEGGSVIKIYHLKKCKNPECLFKNKDTNDLESVEPYSQAETEPDSQAEIETEPEAEPDSQAETEPESEPDSQAETEPESEPDSQAESEPEAEPDSEAESEQLVVRPSRRRMFPINIRRDV